MKISELSAETDVPVGTIKYYLRQGLLPAAERTSRTTAIYHQEHVSRLRLIRALLEEGGLGIAQIRRVVAVLDEDNPQRLDVLATAQCALVGNGPSRPSSDSDAVSRAQTWAADRGWYTTDGDPVIDRLERAWKACEAAGIDLDEAMMSEYADAVEDIARIDVASVSASVEDAVRRVIIGTIMVEPVLAALRLMAQREVAIAEQGDGES